VQRKLERRLLRRAALNRVIGSLEENASHKTRSGGSNETVMACALHSRQASKATQRRHKEFIP
jgi:hypothetical protein